MEPHLDDTIVAVSTPPGRGGIGIVRLAGENATKIANRFVRTSAGGELEWQPARARFGQLIDAKTGERIDEVVATYFQAPHSYTGDYIVEISAHGSPVVLRHIVEQAMEAGARLAEPGEFTMRAFLKGRIDLTQAEAVRDLIESQTLFQAKAAAQQLGGAVSRRLRPIKQDLLNLIAALEAGVDFAEDDVAVLPDGQILAGIAAVRGPLTVLSGSIAYGKLVHGGMTLAIVGRPNVGKSSLFNRLVEREHAIVTAAPGTTRDLVSETVSLDGIPVKLIDTAGIRESENEAERIGIQKSREALAAADVVLLVVDASEAETHDSKKFLQDISEKNPNAIVVENKCDLVPDRSSAMELGATCVRASALTGQGITELRAMVLRKIGGDQSSIEPGFLTNERQAAVVQQALQGLALAQKSVRSRAPHEVLLLDLYGVLKHLDSITGATSTEDILALIFAGFCIGK